MSTSLVLAGLLKPFVMLPFLLLVWWIKRALWRVIPAGRVRDALFRERFMGRSSRAATARRRSASSP
jgi:hypothetical protein